MPNHTLTHNLFLAWLPPLAVAGLLAACSGGDKDAAGGAGASAGGAPAASGTAGESQSTRAIPAAADTQAAADTTAGASRAAADTQAAGSAKAAAGSGPDDPKLIALGDSIFHGQAGGGTCYACHGQDGKGSAVGANLTDGEWLNSDGSYDAIVKTIQTGVPKPTRAPAPMPPMGGASLTPDQVKAVAAYVYSLRGGKG